VRRGDSALTNKFSVAKAIKTRGRDSQHGVASPGGVANRREVGIAKMGK